MNLNEHNISNFVRRAEIDHLLRDGLIKETTHESGELCIYNYTARAQYEDIFSKYPAIGEYRGLILDKRYNIVARPFPKFFNLSYHEERGDIPNEDFDVFEKLDGSLGILYFYQDKPYIATRGSFTSPQAIKATEMLYTKYKDSIPLLDKSLTYLFEIIYPENRIVVDYGDDEHLILLAAIQTYSGLEVHETEYNKLGFLLVGKYDGIHDIKELSKLNESNREGFVVRFKNGIRIKIKFEEYVKLHSFITEASKKKIWEMLKDNIPFEGLIEKIPDEMYKLVKETKEEILEAYKEVERIALIDFDKIRFIDSRKDFAMAASTYQYPSILFSLLDKKDYSKHIWKLIKPESELPIWDKED